MRLSNRIMTNHEQAMEARGVTMRELVMDTGLTEAGVRKCLKLAQAPHNPLARAKYLRLLGLTEETA